MKTHMYSRNQISRKSAVLELIYLLMAVGLISTFVLVRYGQSWSPGGDTHSFTLRIRDILSSGKLLTESVYANGYGFQSLAVTSIHVSGINIRTFQYFGASLLVLWVVIPAWLLYRELTGSKRVALIALVLLFSQPEFLFGILRGTHEKFTRGLMFICFYLLLRSANQKNNNSRFLAFIFVFYLSAFALITFNNLWATSFTVALFLAFLIMFSLAMIKKGQYSDLELFSKRILLVVFILIIASFIFIFYVYPPAKNQILIIESIGERISLLFLPMDSLSINPYSVINKGWINLPTYFLVSISNWVTLFVSLAIWVFQTRTLVFGDENRNQREIVLWALYTSFAALSALSIVIDYSGAIAGNLQHRVFGSFAMISSPYIANSLVERYGRRQVLSPTPVWVLWVVCSFMAFAALLKATNEPLISNKWLFFSPGEMFSLEWADRSLTNRGIWAGFDERLTSAYGVYYADTPLSIALLENHIARGTRDFLISEITVARSERLRLALPTRSSDLITYDNGDVQIFHRQPVTPYQR